MWNFLSRYALAVCVIAYMAVILVLHLFGLFPRPGIYDLARLVGTSQLTIEGRVLDMPVIRWNQTRFLVMGEAWPLGAFTGQTVVTLAFIQDDLAPGDRIRVRGWVSAPRPASLRRDFDEQGYWATRKVFSMLKVWSPEALTIVHRSAPWSLGRAAWAFHAKYRAFWEDALPEDEANLLLGITLGARGILPKPLKEACIRAGVYHIVVVSGQNMSLIVGLGVSFLILMRVPRRHALWVCAAPVVFYTCVVGGDPPVVRAAAMALIGLLSSSCGRDIPRYYPFFLAAAWILLREPEAILGASFQLSFGATLSILAIFPLWDGFWSVRPHIGGRVGNRWQRWVKEAGIMGLTVHLGIWPILVYYFHRLSFAGFFANWTVFPLSGILMVLGLAVGSWGVIAPRGVPDFLIQGIRLLVHMTLRIIQRMGSWSWAVRPMAPPPWWVLVLYYGVLFGILFQIRRRKIYGQIHPPFAARRSGIQRR